MRQPQNKYQERGLTRSHCEVCGTLRRCINTWLDKSLIRYIYPALEFIGPFNSGELIYQEGDLANFLYIVRTGSVKVTKPFVTGSYDIDGFYFPGNLFGLCAIDQDVQNYNAYALEETVICRLPIEKMESVSEYFPRLQQLLITELSTRSRELSQRLYNERHVSAVERLRLFLLDIFEQNMEQITNNEGRFVFPMSKNDISLFLGMRPESLSRKLTELERSGLIKNHQRYIEYINYKKMISSTSSSRRS